MADHPDRPGGDAQRFNEALQAYRLLQAKFQAAGVSAKAPAPAAPVIVTITPKEAENRGCKAREAQQPTTIAGPTTTKPKPATSPKALLPAVSPKASASAVAMQIVSPRAK